MHDSAANVRVRLFFLRGVGVFERLGRMLDQRRCLAIEPLADRRARMGDGFRNVIFLREPECRQKQESAGGGESDP